MASNLLHRIAATNVLSASKSLLVQPVLRLDWIPRCLFSSSQMLEKFYLKRSYLKRWGRRDIKRRQTVAEHEIERTNLRMLKKADFLPYGVKAKAAEDIQKLPRDSNYIRIRNRCTLTDRPRGLVGRYRISRMEFRYFGEKALIAGVQKSCW